MNAPTYKQENFRLKLFANKSALWLKLIATRLKLIATELANNEFGSNYLQMAECHSDAGLEPLLVSRDNKIPAIPSLAPAWL